MTSVVYFALSNGLIKIGTTVDLTRRLETLRSQSAAAVSLIGSAAGDASYERATHDCLEAYRRHGEWFVDRPPLRHVIYDIINHGFEAAGISPLGDAADLGETVAEAWKLARLITDSSGLRPHEAEQHFGLPSNSLWSLLYRAPKQINADTYLDLIRVAGVAVASAQARLSDDAAFVADLALRRGDRRAVIDEAFEGISALRLRIRSLADSDRQS